MVLDGLQYLVSFVGGMACHHIHKSNYVSCKENVSAMNEYKHRFTVKQLMLVYLLTGTTIIYEQTGIQPHQVHLLTGPGIQSHQLNFSSRKLH